MYPREANPAGMPEVALAILRWQDGFLMQLRDNDPNIRAPWHWGLFGGHLERGEQPEAAVLRELHEELAYEAPSATQLHSFLDGDVFRHLFDVPLLVPPSWLVQAEGRDMQVVSPAGIREGWAWSPVEGVSRPLVPGLRTALLAYCEERGL